MSRNFCIRIEVIANGYTVEIPDVEAIDAAEAAAKKGKAGASPSVYYGEYMKEYAAKTVKDVIALVTPALKNLPQSQYDEAFDEASRAKD